MGNIVVLQHTPVETLGTIGDAIQQRSMSFTYIRLFAGESVPNTIDSASALVVMGGPMGVYEDDYYPYLRDEVRLIREAISLHKPILGVCLGSQLIATALGSSVQKGIRKEIGWHTVSLKPSGVHDKLFKGLPPTFVPFHWHGDFFELPHGAVSLASSELTEHQAFLYGDRVYGLLFHLEATKNLIGGMLKSFSEELESEGLDRREIMNQVDQRLASAARLGEVIFGRWAEFVLRQDGSRATAGY